METIEVRLTFCKLESKLLGLNPPVMSSRHDSAIAKALHIDHRQHSLSNATLSNTADAKENIGELGHATGVVSQHIMSHNSLFTL